MTDWIPDYDLEQGPGCLTIICGIIGCVVGGVMATAAEYGAFGPTDPGLSGKAVLFAVTGAIAFAVSMVAIFLLFAGGAATLVGVGVVLAGIGYAAYLVIPPSEKQLAFECLETEFRPFDSRPVESWTAAVEELEVTWQVYGCTADKGGYLTGTAPYGDGEAHLEFLSGNTGTYFDREFQEWILFRCDGPLEHETNDFVRRCLEGLDDEEYLSVFDQHRHEVASTGEQVEVPLDQHRFRHWDTTVLIRPEGVTVHHGVE